MSPWNSGATGDSDEEEFEDDDEDADIQAFDDEQEPQTSGGADVRLRIDENYRTFLVHP